MHTDTCVQRREEARGGFCMHFMSLCERFSARHARLMEKKKKRHQLAAARVPHVAATNYPSGFGQGSSSSGSGLFLSESPPGSDSLASAQRFTFCSPGFAVLKSSVPSRMI